MVKQACSVCKKLVVGDHCPLHPEAKLINNWKGRIIVLNPEKSELAKKVSIIDKGEYAIRI